MASNASHTGYHEVTHDKVPHLSADEWHALNRLRESILGPDGTGHILLHLPANEQKLLIQRYMQQEHNVRVAEAAAIKRCEELQHELHLYRDTSNQKQQQIDSQA